MLQTEFTFNLPKGFIDADGNLHREGVMRLASAADEIAPLQDPRVQRNGAYMSVILLSRVITRLGSLPDVNPTIVERMFASDVSYLQSLYQKLNANGHAHSSVSCPHCNEEFEIDDGDSLREETLGE